MCTKVGSSACRGIRSPSLFLEAICERYVADGIKVRDDVACGVTKSASSYSCQGRVRDLDLARVFPRNEIEVGKALTKVTRLSRFGKC